MPQRLHMPKRLLRSSGKPGAVRSLQSALSDRQCDLLVVEVLEGTIDQARTELDNVAKCRRPVVVMLALKE